MLRYASGVAGPTEFLTLTVWESRSAMQSFMRSGDHERLMWLFSRWTASFWGMRWEPSTQEIGAWAGLRLASATATPRPVSPLVAVGLLPPSAPRAGPTGPRRESGGIEPRACGLVGVTARFSDPRALLAAHDLRRRLRPGGAGSPEVVRCSVGWDAPPQALAIGLWRDTAAARTQALSTLEDAGADWAMCWQPADYEIGHWDGLRLRQAARRRVPRS